MIETLDGSIIAFQNSQLFNKNFRNMTRNHKFECVKVEVGISYGTDVERARKIILETLATLPFLSKVKRKPAWCWTVSETVPSIWAYGSGFPS